MDVGQFGMRVGQICMDVGQFGLSEPGFGGIFGISGMDDLYGEVDQKWHG